MTTVLFPGSFDPVHLGHVAVVEQLAATHDRVVVGVLGNPRKQGLFTHAERVALLRRSLEHVPAAEVVSHDGLVVDLATEVGATVIARAAGKEATDELVMAETNRSVSGLRTVLVAPRASVASIASRQVRELVLAGRLDLVEPLVPAPVHAALLERSRAAGGP